MKKLSASIVCLIALLFVSVAAEPVAPPKVCVDDGSFRTFFNTTEAHKVTIRSEGGVVTVLEVPEGVFLSVFGGAEATRSETSEADRSVSFSGDLTLRARRRDEMAVGESRNADDIMAKAPLEMKLESASVTVEIVAP